jgi:hypothetical protein
MTLLLLAVLSGGDMTPPSDFVARRVTRTRVQTYAAPPAVVFPLHGPLEEAAWAVGWHPEMIHPAGGAPAAEGAIFVTRHGGAEAVWVLTTWDPARGRVRYVHVSQGRDVTGIDIRISGPEAGPTRVEVAYTGTGLSPAGNAFVESWTEETFGRMMDEWQEEMGHYLRTGRKLERQAAPPATPALTVP